MLSTELQAEILVRHLRDRESARKIARDLGINRKSVRQIIERRAIKDTIERGKRPSLLDAFESQGGSAVSYGCPAFLRLDQTCRSERFLLRFFAC